jgi:hypothetical protein
VIEPPRARAKGCCSIAALHHPVQDRLHQAELLARPIGLHGHPRIVRLAAANAIDELAQCSLAARHRRVARCSRLSGRAIRRRRCDGEVLRGGSRQHDLDAALRGVGTHHWVMVAMMEYGDSALN